MKKLTCLFIFICLGVSGTFAKNLNNITLKGNGNVVVNKLESFIKEKKFQADETLMYPGITSKTLKTKLTDLVNESARDFMQLFSTNANEEEYQNKIKTGLERFDLYFTELTSEDLDRIYHYYEQLIDIVGLKNQGTHLKKWRYGTTSSKK
ncbi:MAG: DUF4844 domain-containing protein [Bacteroidia bacterium]|nr:DUF4844 domain-containing protein [Bacteroidia bacterium]